MGGYWRMSACAAIVGGAAYFFWLAAERLALLALTRARSSARARPPARGGRGRCAGNRRHRRGGGHAGHPLGAGNRRAARQRRGQDRASTGRSSRCSSRKAMSSRKATCCSASMTGMVKAQIAQAAGEHRQGSGRPARRGGHAGPARGPDRQAGRHRGCARPGTLCGRGAQGQHRRRPGAAGVAEDAARLSHHPRAHHRPHRQPQRQGRRHRARRSDTLPLVTINQTQADPGELLRAAESSCRRCGVRSHPRPWPRS